MKRKTFNFAAILSMLLCVATVVLWVRSIWIHDEISRVMERSAVSVISLRGRIQVETVSADRPVYVKSWNWKRRPIGGSFDEIQDRFSWEFGGFWLSQTNGFNAIFFRASLQTFVMPYWFLVGLFGVPPLWALRSIRRSGLNNHCPTCLYNLTGNTSGICPECGTPIPSASEQKSLRPA